MKLEGLKVGLAITGSFCTFEKIVPEVQKLVEQKAEVYPIFSTNAAAMDTRFGKAEEWVAKFEEITGHKAVKTIQDAEPIGPKELIDVLVIAPCTGNQLQIQNYLDFISICLDVFYKIGYSVFQSFGFHGRKPCFESRVVITVSLGIISGL